MADGVCLCTTVALGSAYVRFSMYDVRLQSCARCAGFGRACASGLSWSCDRMWLQRGGGRRGLPMYDFRCTMDDCRACARCAGFGGGGASGLSWSCDRGWLQRGGGRRGLPMYDFRCTMYDLGSSRALRGFFLMRIDDNTGKQEFFSADELLSNAFAVCLMQGTREATCTEE